MIVKPEQHEQELTIFACRHEVGLQALREWLFARRDDINKNWPGMLGEELVRLQGEAKTVAKLIRLIDLGPSVKKLSEEN